MTPSVSNVFSAPLAVEGVAITGGLELVLACDMVVVYQPSIGAPYRPQVPASVTNALTDSMLTQAATNAKFQDTHAKFGILPFWGLSQKLSKIVGVNRARSASTFLTLLTPVFQNSVEPMPDTHLRRKGLASSYAHMPRDRRLSTFNIYARYNCHRQMSLTAQPVSAVEAEKWGLVNELTVPGGALDRAISIARQIASHVRDT